MKRYNNLFEDITSYNNLQIAHNRAQKDKKHYPEVIKINKDREKYLTRLHKQLKNKEFVNSAYETYTKKELKKERLIHKLPYYPDRIVHHAIMNVCESFWHNSLIRDTYSSLKGRGVHDGVKRMKTFLGDRENTTYCLKFDISKFYPSINNDILFNEILPKKIKCKDTLWLLEKIIYSTVGLPIGNYLSQIWGNLYLSPFDWYIKQNKRIKYYSRYCDDLVILHEDKEYLQDILSESIDWLWGNLKLEVKGNYQVFPRFERPIDFLGYVFCDGYILIRKDIKTAFIRKINNIRKNWNNMAHSKVINTIMSYYGWFKHANAINLWNKHIDNEIRQIVNVMCKKNNTKNPMRKIKYA